MNAYRTAKARVAKLSGTPLIGALSSTCSFALSAGILSHKSVFPFIVSPSLMGILAKGKWDIGPNGDSPTCHCKLSVPVFDIVNRRDVEPPGGTVAWIASGLTVMIGARTLRVADA